MKDKIQLGSSILLLSAMTQPAFAQIPEKGNATSKLPNILCIVCEDISPRLACYGDPAAVTPNLDNFAKDAVRYTRMFTSIGVSAPSRFSLITGLYPSSHGGNQMRNFSKALPSFPPGIEPYEVVLPDGVKCFTEFMRQAGYYCTNNAKTDYQFASPLTAWDECNNKAHWNHRPEGMPFFSIFNLNVTHESQVWERANKPLVVDPHKIPVPPYYVNDSVIRRDMAIMYSNIFEMDKQTQKLIDEVKAAGEADNTIIIWYSDNGGPLPREKREVYESGTLVPFMIRFPDGFRKGDIENRLCMFADIPATILSLAGIKPPSYMHGQAFLGAYTENKERKYVYGAHDRMDEQIDKIGAVRDKQFRYIKNYMTGKSGYMPVKFRLQMPLMQRMVELYEQGELNDAQKRWFMTPRPEEEFYDVENDPSEIHNLIDVPHYQKEIKRLRVEYQKWLDKYNTEWFISEKEKRDKMWPAGIQPKVDNLKIEQTAQGIIASSPTKGASFAYQINGKGYRNNAQWFIYSGAIKATKGDIITIIGVRIGYKNSDTATYKVI